MLEVEKTDDSRGPEDRHLSHGDEFRRQISTQSTVSTRLSGCRPAPLEPPKQQLTLPIHGKNPYRLVSLGQGNSQIEPKQQAEFTLRAVLVGLGVGTLLCFTNTFFGLQTGWVTMGSIQAAVVGFGICRVVFPKNNPLTALENVVLQTVSVATATMPLTGGFVGIVPALGLLNPPLRMNSLQLLWWCSTMTYFGIFFTVPLRRQTILVERLPFPSGTATANIIDLMHSQTQDPELLASRWRSLSIAFGLSFAVSMICFWWADLSNMKVGTWIGLPILTTWHWTWRPAPSYIGQGMIMGSVPVFSMLLGAIIAWAVLGPFAKAVKWAPGAVESWKDGPQGWVLWVALGLMLGEAMSSFVLSFFKGVDMIVEAVTPSFRGCQDVPFGEAEEEVDLLEVAPTNQLVPASWWISGLILSSVLSALVIAPLLAIPMWQSLLAVLLSCLTSVLAVRALGQTDLNPVSGVGKISQIIFAVLAPGNLVTNLVAGAFVEAGAGQAGDMMQALKTGHIVGSSPRAQFYGQLVGSTASIFVTVAAYELIYNLYGIPSDKFEAPVAHVWLQMAWLMKVGVGALPYSARVSAGLSAAVGILLPVLEHLGKAQASKYRHYVPSGVAVGIGMYLTPDWTLPRVIGAVALMVWKKVNFLSSERHSVMVASGLVLGEVMMSLLALGLKSIHA